MLTYPIPNYPFLNCLSSGLSSIQQECKIHCAVHPLQLLWEHWLTVDYSKVNVVFLFLFNSFLSLSSETVYLLWGKFRRWFKFFFELVPKILNQYNFFEPVPKVKILKKNFNFWGVIKNVFNMSLPFVHFLNFSISSLHSFHS